MVFGLQRFCSLSRRLRFNNTIIHLFELLFIANLRLCIRFHDAWLSFTRHRGSHKSFQFSSCVVENFWVFSVVWINKINSPQSSSIVELRFSFFPFLFFSILSGITNFCPNFWPYMIWSGSCLDLCQPLLSYSSIVHHLSGVNACRLQVHISEHSLVIALARLTLRNACIVCGVDLSTFSAERPIPNAPKRHLFARSPNPEVLSVRWKRS